MCMCARVSGGDFSLQHPVWTGEVHVPSLCSRTQAAEWRPEHTLFAGSRSKRVKRVFKVLTFFWGYSTLYTASFFHLRFGAASSEVSTCRSMAVDPDSRAAPDTSKRMASLALQVSNVCANKTHMAHLLLAPFASHLYEVAALVKEMQREAEIRNVVLPIASMSDMDSLLRNTEQLVQNYSGRSSLYLLMCCPDLLCQLKQMHARLKATLAAFCSDDCGWSAFLELRCSEELRALEQAAATKLGPKEQSLHDSLEQGIIDSIVTDAVLTVKLGKQIVEALGFSSLNSEGFESEVSKLKLEKDRTEVRRRGMAHALYLQQFIVLLDKVMAANSSATNNQALRLSSSTRKSDKVNGHSKSGSGAGAAVRDTLVLPLQSFICPFTKDVMKDPVQIASGQTYERQAIERWFEDGHTRCPTGVELTNIHMKSNIALKQSIKEWKDRNNSIWLDVAADLMCSPVKEQQLKSLVDLQALCQEDSLCKYKVASKNVLPLLVRLAESGDSELSVHAWSLLGLLAENEECLHI
ncbi:hypothetical protein L7F22_064364 [Adiantum nelumboides]|nr:hypothetical protein [Adiantum nelumboides]